MWVFPSSLAARINWVGALVTCALVVLVALLVDATQRTRDSSAWVSHTYQVIQTLDELVSDVREAESGQRGYLLTHDPSFTMTFDGRINQAGRDGARLQWLVRDNPSQTVRARAVRGVLAEKIATLAGPLKLARASRFAEGNALIASGFGRRLMEQVTSRADAMKAEERRLLAIRTGDVEQRSRWNTLLALVGGLGIVLVLAVSIAMLVRSIRRPIAAMLEAMTAFGSGDHDARITKPAGTREFRRLAGGYNMMADQLGLAMRRLSESDGQLQLVNTALVQRSDELAARGTAIELLGGMAHRMQAARTDDELGAILACFVPQVLPRVAGALYAHNHSRNMLVKLAEWGDSHAIDTFAPGDCWALRRGQSHAVEQRGMDVRCTHVTEAIGVYHCEPMLAAGEVIGLIHLEGVIEPECRFRLAILTENVASALTNLRLQRGLREQTIRDPLTGLFNRRYMEEALSLEVARASRARSPLCVVMCDVDHFKRFNDEHGHDAGDELLRALSAEMAKFFRDGDIVCRYGGEEFTIIVPGVTPSVAAVRIETLRERIAAISLRHCGGALGPVSMSFGIAAWTDEMSRDGSTLVQAADAALYRAKRAGRNRAIIAEQEAA